MAPRLGIKGAIVKFLLPGAKLILNKVIGIKKFTVVQLYTYEDYIISYKYETPRFEEIAGLDPNDLTNLAGAKYLPIDEDDEDYDPNNLDTNKYNGLKSLLKNNITVVKRDEFDVPEFATDNDIKDIGDIYNLLESFYPGEPKTIRDQLFEIALRSV